MNRCKWLGQSGSRLMLMCVLAVSAAFNPVFLLGIAWLGLSWRSQIMDLSLDAIERPLLMPALVFFAPLFIYYAAIWHSLPLATPDDLMRHMVAYRHRYAYSGRFLYQQVAFPTQSLWIGFEVVAGAVHRALGTVGTSMVFVLGILLLFFSSMYFSLRKVFQKSFVTRGLRASDADTAFVLSVAFAVFLIFQPTARMLLARPEAFCTVAAMAVFSLRPRYWLVVMIAITPMYWLSFLYAPFAFLIPDMSWRRRAAIVVGIFTCSVAFWSCYMGHEWLRMIEETSRVVGSRLLAPSEGQKVIGLLTEPSVALATLAWLASIPYSMRRAHIGYLIVIGWFLLADQNRYYASNILPLMAVSFVQAIGERMATRSSTCASPFPRHFRASILAALALFAGATIYMKPENPLRLWPNLKTLRAEDKVMTGWDEGLFYLLNQHPNIQVWPSVEFGYSEMSMQKLYVDMAKSGKADCNALLTKSFTHFLDKGILRGEPPGCLAVQERSRNWTLYKVVR